MRAILFWGNVQCSTINIQCSFESHYCRFKIIVLTRPQKNGVKKIPADSGRAKHDEQKGCPSPDVLH
jgi:hypothetical protein